MALGAVFLDGGYIEKVLRYDFGEPRIHFGRLAKEMIKPDELLRAYYYHCPPYQSNPSTEEERERYANSHRFFTALSFLQRFEVRLGRLEFRGLDENGEPIFVQKRIDCMIGVDMALLAGKGRITTLALFSGDSDLIPAIEAVKIEGVLVKLWHGSFSPKTSPHRELVQAFDDRFEFTQETVDKILL